MFSLYISDEVFLEGGQVIIDPVFLLELLIGVPLLERLVDFFLAEIEHCFRVFTASFLQAPGGLVSEVQTFIIWFWAAGTSVRAKVVAVVDSSPIHHFLINSEHTIIVAFYGSCVLPIFPRVLFNFLRVRVVIPAGDDVDDDVRGVFHYFEALIYGGVDIDVPHCSAISEYVAIPVPRLESEWNRA